MAEQWRIRWHDSGREPQVAPNPAYPDGTDLDLTMGLRPFCKIALPYPARRCGYYSVACLDCGMHVAITTAGRKDDPRSVTLPCCKEGRHHAS